jgi:SHS2 domain-containing protein
LEQVLVKWLAEILYLYDGMKFAAARFEISELTPTSLSATVHGEPFSSDRHAARLDVKAITYHQLLCEQTATGARLQVFLDI